MDYQEFLRAKKAPIVNSGFPVDPLEINPLLKPHQRIVVQWMVEGGRRACFAQFGLGKTLIQLEAVRLTKERAGGKGLIIMPLGVSQEFARDASMIGTETKFIRRIEEADNESTIYLTNYETIRDGKMSPDHFSVCSLDEAGCLRAFGGSKTFREFMRLLAGDDHTGTYRDGVKYRYVATATPAPNEYIEILCYAAYLGICDVSQGKTRFFKRDSSKADRLTLHPHKEKEFWLWVSSWGLFLQKPSDLGFSDEGYIMPELDVRWHCVPSDNSTAGFTKSGQARLFANAALGVQESAREKRSSLQARIDKMVELRTEDPDAHRLIWHDLEAERHAIGKAIPTVKTVYGSQSDDAKEENIIGFSDGNIQELACKPRMLGQGCNFQRHCNWAIYLGIGFKFNDFIQSVHRIQRFLQTKKCRIDLIYTEAEAGIRKTLERKWAQHNRLVNNMTEIIREYGLSSASLAEAMIRSFGVERVEVSGEHFSMVNNDCVLEAREMAENSVGLILTSVPFSTQFEYSANYSDFGHTNDNEHFFEQMDYLTPNLLRVLQPGRIAAIHVKDRIVPGGLTGLGFQTVYPFHARCIKHYTQHGFAYMGMKTIVTDVVRENNQTYRLGWTEQCKDGTKMGVGMPEYLLLFRKPPTDTSNSYGDFPVIKSKNRYTRARWQVDAHGFERSSGDRLMVPEELTGLSHDQIFKIFRDYSLHEIYEYEHHVRIGEALDAKGMLPVTFMLLQPQSWSSEVWTDIARMRTLNSLQYAKGREMHLCPLPFDIVDRVIDQLSMPGEVVFDPFAGIGTVPYRAILKGRYGLGVELSAQYFTDAVYYCNAAEQKKSVPTLFDIAVNE